MKGKQGEWKLLEQSRSAQGQGARGSPELFNPGGPMLRPQDTLRTSKILSFKIKRKKNGYKNNISLDYICPSQS